MEEEHQQFSGAFLRSLVKQMTSPNPNYPTNNPNDPQQPQRHKKQIRRRLHATRPSQGRLLNMAEARKEIVTALRYHRAAMKQQQRQQQQLITSYLEQEHEVKVQSWRSPTPYTSNHHFVPWAAPGPTQESPKLSSQAWPAPQVSSPSSSSTVSGVSSEVDAPSWVVSDDPDGRRAAADRGGGLHQAMGEEEMAEIRSIGELHAVEWNDTINSMTSAWWFDFLNGFIDDDDDDGDEFVQS